MNEDRPADTVLTDAPAEGAESDPWDFDNAPATLPAEPPGPGATQATPVPATAPREGTVGSNVGERAITLEDVTARRR